jgi:hypothetical protein
MRVDFPHPGLPVMKMFIFVCGPEFYHLDEDFAGRLFFPHFARLLCSQKQEGIEVIPPHRAHRLVVQRPRHKRTAEPACVVIGLP